jgi:hypothetical protein
MLGISYEMVGESRRAIAEYEVFLEIWNYADTYLEDVSDASLRLTSLKTI